MQARVVVGCFNPVDLAGGQENVFGSVANDEALLIRLFVARRSLQGSERLGELVLREKGCTTGDSLLYTSECLLEAKVFDGLGEVIDGVDGEGFDGELLMRCDEDRFSGNGELGAPATVYAAIENGRRDGRCPTLIPRISSYVLVRQNQPYAM